MEQGPQDIDPVRAGIKTDIYFGLEPTLIFRCTSERYSMNLMDNILSKTIKEIMLSVVTRGVDGALETARARTIK